MKNIKTKAFTLIELMVVVSIVAVMSSISLVALNSAREKARIASLLQFDANIYRALGDKLIAAYEFSDSSNLAKDNSTNGYNGTFEGAAGDQNPTSQTGIRGPALDTNFSKTIRVTNLPNLSSFPEGFTVSFFVYLRSAYGNLVNGSGVGSAHPLYNDCKFGFAGLTQAWTNNNTGACGNATRAYLNPNLAINLNKWSHVLLTYKDGISRYYIDGKYYGQSTITDGLNTGVGITNIGGFYSTGGDTWRMNGMIDDVRIYGKAIQ